MAYPKFLVLNLGRELDRFVDELEVVDKEFAEAASVDCFLREVFEHAYSRQYRAGVTQAYITECAGMVHVSKAHLMAAAVRKFCSAVVWYLDTNLIYTSDGFLQYIYRQRLDDAIILEYFPF